MFSLPWGSLTKNVVFFFNDTATTEIYTLSLHDALPVSLRQALGEEVPDELIAARFQQPFARSEEHTSELQSHVNLVCRLLLEKKHHLIISNVLTDHAENNALHLAPQPETCRRCRYRHSTVNTHPPHSPCSFPVLFFFNDTATTKIYPLSLHDALPI